MKFSPEKDGERSVGRWGHSYVRLGITTFATVAAILLFYDTLFGSRTLLLLGSSLLEAMAPVLYGAMIAYLLAPIVNFLDGALFPKTMARIRAEKKLCAALPRAVSLLITFLLLSVMVYILLSMLLPELYKSVMQLIANLETYYTTINSWIRNLMDKNPGAESWVMETVDTYYQTLLDWLTQKALPQAQQLVSALSGGVMSVLNFAKNLVVGLIVSVYLLATKELNAAHGRKLLYGLFSQERTRWILRGVHKVDLIFSGFVRGKLLDSLIIGIICFVGCSLLRFPFTVLISVIVGVTNVIPFFGPFLGAVPSLFLILLDSPIKALYFLLFIIALQQVDGNIIGPKILGDRTGISSMGVIVAILVGGHFFSVPGMFFGVPVLACSCTAVAYFVNTRLRRKNMPLAAEAYRQDAPDKAFPAAQRREPPPGGEDAR